MGFIDQLKAVWPLVTQAPWGFAPVAFAILASGWAVGRFMYSQRIAILKERIEAYKEKLDGASPEEAHARVERLEARIRDLEHDPRLFSPEQLAKIAAVLKRHKPGAVIVSRDGSSLLCGKVQTQIRKLFERHGWEVRHWATMGGDKLPASGLTIYGNTGDTETDDELVVREALQAAGIEFELRRQRSTDKEPQLVFSDID
ncbi:hypothetical protein EN833_08310 [Mesorhizobium sp. M4B.F.Ca.ET.190.01.1.1]|uniref:hypothetical protein n=1 Tax=unclassified Mesorhizobium TaxID=325217 RepID=UPI000FE38364|nr:MULTISPECIES: hypothetical protein [unclassified Mesorhizobium]RWX60446.1 hypothetical protein EN780_32005 [Mesorhizobium sp. M4B.F.Ca.ET.089.01.1.1]TGR13164.1 hypothetical protein EN843_08305 [Mesorhizobium sp. M4B.F.Ca.ET.200.01.1.1]TGS21375.1 hypothetical protein EN833_08310 [Mesorhizobium sp. M4B.F.Ca.ET.190.01.1.1]TGT32938.1 hypothetical protein EN815_10850 [Mesorhizobium sp. M4B.F.Ca.ET.172.01.1.1]